MAFVIETLKHKLLIDMFKVHTFAKKSSYVQYFVPIHNVFQLHACALFAYLEIIALAYLLIIETPLACQIMSAINNVMRLGDTSYPTGIKLNLNPVSNTAKFDILCTL